MKIVTLLLSVIASLYSASGWAAAKPIPDPPAINATSYFLIDFESGRVLAENNPDEHIEPASITKLMTAYLVDKAIADGDISLDDMVTISEKAWRMKGSKMFVEVGKQVSVEDLLKGFPLEYRRVLLHNMAQIHGGMVLGVIAAQESLRQGKTIDDLQDLVHQYCDECQEFVRQEREL